MSTQSSFQSNPIPFESFPIVQVESIDLNANGIAHYGKDAETPEKVIFIEGALPKEKVAFKVYRKKSNYDQAHLIHIYQESVLRTQPQCPSFGICGGCSMQHLETQAQVAIKQRVLEDNIQRIAQIKPETFFSPIYGPAWHYRFRARLSVRFVKKKNEILVGFHEKKSHYIVDMKTCEVLPKHVSHLLVPLRKLIADLSIRDQVPQIELAVAEKTTALVLRIMSPLNKKDELLLKTFSQTYQVQFWLQPKGPDTAYPFYPEDLELAYSLPEFNLRIPFKPTDFTQVNHEINRVLVSRAMQLLEIQPTDRVLDLFCGIGNFTLPLARKAAQVVGIEGSDALVKRAQANAEDNQLANRVSFKCRNLFKIEVNELLDLGYFHRVLIDPPREGAMAVCLAFASFAENGQADQLPKRIVYVSCNPATLARDAGILVNKAGYRLLGAGVVNMFPHTSHVESIAVFAKD